MASAKDREALERWRKHCEEVKSSTSFSSKETPTEKTRRIHKLLGDYRAFVEYYFPHYTYNEVLGRSIPSAPFHLAAAKSIRDTPNLKAVFQWARGHAKSTHMDVFIPLWLKAHSILGKREINVMVLVGKSEDNAQTLLSDVQAELEYNQRYIADFGHQVSSGSWEAGRFVTADEVAFFALGRGQSPRGLRYRSHRPDYIVIDDLDDDVLVQNKDRVNKLTDWVREALFGALDGGRGRFIMIGNLISKTSVLYNISHTPTVHVSRVNILTSKGEVTWAAKWSREEVAELEAFSTYRAFQKEYMNNPITAGSVFRPEWIRYKKVSRLTDYSGLILYIDPSWKGTTKNDYKAAKLWGSLPSGELHHIKAFLRQCSISELVRWVYDTYEWVRDEGASLRIYLEAGFMQDSLLDDFSAEGNVRGYQLPISPDRRKKENKFARIEAISPLWERGKVYYNEAEQSSPDMLVAVEQTLSMEKGMRGHDDGPDADEGAIWLLQRSARTLGIAPKVGKRTNNIRHQW